MRLFVLLLCLASGASLFFTSLGETNEMPMGLVGGGPSPKGHHQSIRMESEEVTIKLLYDSYIVDAVFHFFNAGETTTEWVGFPKVFGKTFQFIKFETWVNDQEVEFTEVSEKGNLPGLWDSVHKFLSDEDGEPTGVPGDHWMAKKVTFSGHSATVTRVRYKAKYEGICARYIYGTGSFWNGTIGKAVFIIDGNQASKMNFRVRGEPATSTQTLISPKQVKYEISDFKPSDPHAEIEVCFCSEHEAKRDSYFLLDQAVRRGDTAAVEGLLAEGGDVNAMTPSELTLLMEASLSGRVETVKVLLDKGAGVNAIGFFGRTALMYASWFGHVEVLKTLLDKGADVNAKDRDGGTALMWASRSRNVEPVKVLLDKVLFPTLD